MADISKINAVLIANIAEIDDVLAANIAKVNGLVFSTAPAFTGIFDTYSGGAAGYSTRRLYGQYTGAALRVREDSGDTETDIGFDSNGDLDTAAIASHCGTANGYVTKWYGQESSGGTGSGNDATQTTSGSQPQIYDGSAVITENGKPAVSFLSTRYLVTPFDTSTSAFDLPQTMYVATRIVSPGSYLNFSFIICGGNVSFSLGKFEMTAQQGVGTSTQYRTTSPIVDSVTDYTDTAMYLHGGYYGSSLMKTAYNGAALTSGTSITEGDYTNTDLAIGGTGTTSNGTFNVSEYLLWHSDQSTNKSGIEVNINDHYLIGNFPNPTSGLLYDYSGAAAAYSVRQLANTAALAMRIREDGTDTETDIGFDSNGDLDTAAISSHCGSNNGYVVTWYDQSGEQNDATQGTSGSQPQIYNGTAVVTDNGKSALDFDGSNDFFGSIAVASATANTITTVLNPDIVTGGARKIFARPNSTAYQFRQSGNQFNFIDYELSPTQFTIASETGVSAVQALMFAYITSTNKTARLGYNGGTFNAGSTLTKSLQIIGTAETDAKLGSHRAGVQEYFDGKIQEFILWTNDQSGSRSGIESDINGYFSIYT